MKNKYRIYSWKEVSAESLEEAQATATSSGEMIFSVNDVTKCQPDFPESGEGWFDSQGVEDLLCMLSLSKEDFEGMHLPEVIEIDP